MLLAASAIAVLGRTARTHIVLAELWSAGLIGAFMNGYVLARDFNHEFDRSPNQDYRVEVQDKDISSSRGGSDHYLTVGHWSVRGDTVRQKVYADEYEQVSRGDTVEVVVRSGRLGAHDIEKIRPVE